MALVLVLALLAACPSPRPTLPQAAERSRVFYRPREEVWDVLQRTVERRNGWVMQTDLASGLVVVRFPTGPLWGSMFGDIGSVTVNILVVSEGHDTTRITVQRVLPPPASRFGLGQPSSPLIEHNLLEQIAAGLE